MALTMALTRLGTPQEAEKNQLFIQLLATKKHD